MSDITSNIAFEVFRAFVSVYDVTTLPIYTAVQKPWRKRSKINAVRAKQTNPSDPYSPWVRVGDQPPCMADDCSTIDQVIRQAVTKYGNKRCMGIRRVMSESAEKQPDGKVFVKKTLADNYDWLSYNQVDQRINSVSRGLLANGVRPKDKVRLSQGLRPGLRPGLRLGLRPGLS